MNDLMKRLKSHEGLSLAPYKDVNGYWTIGWGHRLRKWFKPNLEWTAEEADKQFLIDVFHASDEFMKYKRVHYPKLDTVRSEVCVEMVFWMGPFRFKLFRQMNKALAAGDHKLAALELYNSKLGKDPKLRGRARLLAEIMWEGK